MSSSSLFRLGTVTVTTGSAVVEGAFTGWQINAVSGGQFTVDGVTIPIASVEDDTHLTLALVWPASAPVGSGLAYAISRESALAADATYVHNALVNVLRTLAISGVIPDGAGTLAERNAVTPAPPKDYIWLRVEVGVELELSIRSGVGTWIGPFPLRGEMGTPGLGAGGYGLPLAGAVGQALVKTGAGDGVAGWQAIANSVAGQTGTVTAAQVWTALKAIGTFASDLWTALNAENPRVAPLAAPVANLNAVTESGWVAADGSTTNRPGGAGNWLVLTMARTATDVSQVAVSRLDATTWTRANVGGTWGAWVKSAVLADITAAMTPAAISAAYAWASPLDPGGIVLAKSSQVSQQGFGDTIFGANLQLAYLAAGPSIVNNTSFLTGSFVHSNGTKAAGATGGVGLYKVRA